MQLDFNHKKDFLKYVSLQKKMRTIKLIWDFVGDNTEGTADHYAIHLREYLESKKYENYPVGFEKLTPDHAIAFMIIPEDKVIELRDALRPQRGAIVSN